MPSTADNVIPTFPRALYHNRNGRCWRSASPQRSAMVLMFNVHSSRGDDPRIAGRIVVVLRASRELSFMVYSPAESTFWVVTAVSN
jgi:hypothetical protein